MDFVSGLPFDKERRVMTRGYCGSVDQVSSFPPDSYYYTSQRSEQFVVYSRDQIIRLHGVPTSIISDRDPRFTSFGKKRRGPSLQFSF